MINITDLVEVTLNEQDDFLKVRETLTRIGVASKKDKTLYQSCQYFAQGASIMWYTLKNYLL
jgi:hypothetical protein